MDDKIDAERVEKCLPDYFRLIEQPWHIAALILPAFVDDEENFLMQDGHTRNLFHVAKALSIRLADSAQKVAELEVELEKAKSHAHNACVAEEQYLMEQRARKDAEAELETAMNQDRSALETHQASIINLPDKDLLAIAGRLLYRAEEAEAKLAEAQRELETIKLAYGNAETSCSYFKNKFLSEKSRADKLARELAESKGHVSKLNETVRRFQKDYTEAAEARQNLMVSVDNLSARLCWIHKSNLPAPEAKS